MSEPIVQTKTDSRMDEQQLRDARFAMRLSLIFGLVMLGGKTTAYFIHIRLRFFRTRQNRLFT